MANGRETWRAEIQAALADPEVCQALGRAVLAIHGALDPYPRFAALEIAQAYARALAIAHYDATIRSGWRQRLHADGREVGPFPDIQLTDIAQQLCYDAWEAPTTAEQVALAELALRLDPNCADAFTILAETTTHNLHDELLLYEQAMRAGERAIGPDRFAEWKGSFWGIVETRPYMRARCGLADCLWKLGEHQQAIRHYQELLRLNPNDNQGIRYLLASALLEVGDDASFAALIKQWLRTLAPGRGTAARDGADDGEGAAWLYPRALFAFRRHGPGPDAQTALARALRQNRHVPPYLLGHRALPTRLPPASSHGSSEEALSYALIGFQSWRNTPGALDWLAAETPATPRRAGRRKGRDES